MLGTCILASMRATGSSLVVAGSEAVGTEGETAPLLLGEVDDDIVS